MTEFNGVAAAEATILAVLEGGPGDLPQSVRTGRVPAHEKKIKVAHYGGYEHFVRIADPDPAESPNPAAAVPVVFRWTARTKMAE
ncbi:hypothetical protein KGA66_27350 [Actinocrinis puniceicyclus]|uniref:Uncharacterized protein n=1 Tax=Actinocrinis puniceicyclus TaxID=977794 RepID=A0A8J7WSI6_9ACTN|nr:DUF5988 family protein [Actinocrinis puniceicyclus]MBS2966783.1 hypothetical protein [Actinocrinis puniceicyclus]